MSQRMDSSLDDGWALGHCGRGEAARMRTLECQTKEPGFSLEAGLSRAEASGICLVGHRNPQLES